MKKDADVHINRKGLQAAVSRDNALLETILAALPMDGDRQQAEHSWQLFVESKEKSVGLSFSNPNGPK